MKPSDLPECFTIDPSKILGYLLNPQHPDGGAKARFFQRFGFGTDAPDRLAEALLAHPTPENVVGEGVTRLGDRKLVYEGPIPAPDGRRPSVRTVWRVVMGTGLFVTAVPMAGRAATEDLP